MYQTVDQRQICQRDSSNFKPFAAYDEFYFENIKNKLSCSYKHEVLVLAKHFEELGIL